MATIDIKTEEESGRGWVYHVVVDRPGGQTEHTVKLAWVDCELWSGGRVAPSKVIEALVSFLIERECDIPETFDAAAVRRWIPEVDRELPGRF